MMIYFQSVLLLLLFCFFINNAYGNLPDDFDALMEKFFETPECESFVSDATYLSVATSACSPYTCDAPRQLCMREANRYQDETANQCRTVPDSCLTAANGGIPVASSRTIHTTPSPSVFGGMRGNPSATINGNRPPPRIVTAPPDFRGTPPPPPRPFTSGAFGDICQQTVPDGRFCGFQLKFTYNRETGNCEQFWFPGCATDKTNDNLFGDFQSCQIATKHCRATPTQPPPPPPPPPTQPPPPPPHRYTTAFPDYPNSGEEIPPPPPPPPISSRGSSTGGVDLGSLAGSFMGGGGNAGGLVGQFLGGGLGGGGGSSGANIGGGTPNGYGGGALGGGGGGGGNGIGGGGGGGQPNFLKLITNAVGAVGAAKQAAGGAPAGGGAQWLKNIDPQQITSIFSTADDLIPYKQIDRDTLCSFQRDVGHRKCEAPEWSHRFYFDFDLSQCRSFWYFGCGGNLNNFKKIEICKEFCEKN